MNIRVKIDESENFILSCMRTAMISLNLMIILEISLIVVRTTSKIVMSMQAAKFLQELSYIPVEPWKVPAFSIFAFSMLVIQMNFIVPENGDKSFLFYSAIELFFAIFVIYGIGFNSSCVILLVIADLMKYWKYTIPRLIFFIFAFGLYVYIEIAIDQGSFGFIPLQQYVFYYLPEYRVIILGIKNFLVACNLVTFLFYMVFLIQIQYKETQRVIELNKKLDEANEQLKQYAISTEKMVEARERNRLAMEIHDTLGHALTVIIAGVDACHTLLRVNPEAVNEQLDMVSDVARKGMKDIRRSVNALRPDVLENFSLIEAINQIVEETNKTSNTQIVLDNRLKLAKYAEDEEDTIYRTIQESITNAIRHGEATKVWIEMVEDYGSVQVKIRDNGIGCSDIKKGFGLRHMAERIELLNGTLAYSGEDGFQILAKIPIRWGEREL